MPSPVLPLKFAGSSASKYNLHLSSRHPSCFSLLITAEYVFSSLLIQKLGGSGCLLPVPWMPSLILQSLWACPSLVDVLDENQSKLSEDLMEFRRDASMLNVRRGRALGL